MASTQLRVDPSNAEQLEAWDGDEGAYWAGHAERFEQALARYDRAFFAAAAIDSGAHVLDIGCGTGGTTREAGRCATSGSALGVDLSAAMLDVARRAGAREGLVNVRFEQADAQVYPFDEDAFDVAVSRTGAMFFGDPVAAFTNIARAVRRGGRLVLLVWQAMPRNEWLVEIVAALAAGRTLPDPPPGAPGPFAMSDPDRTRSLLTASGFVNVHIEDLREPMYFGSDPRDAGRFVAGLMGWLLHDLDEAGRGRAIDALHATMERHHTDSGVMFSSAAWLVSAARR